MATTEPGARPDTVGLEGRGRPDDDEAHDRGLIVQRLSWTPAERLEANAAFLRFYLALRPDGPLIRDE